MIKKFNRLYNRFYSALMVLFCRDVILVHVTQPADVAPLVRLTVWDTIHDDGLVASVLRAAANDYATDAQAAGKPCIVHPHIHEN